MNYLLYLLGWVALQAAWQTVAAALALVWSLRRMRCAPAVQRYRCAVLHLAGAICALPLSLAASHLSIALGPKLPSPGIAGQQWWLPGVAGQDRTFLPALACVWLSGAVIAQLLLAMQWLRLRLVLRSTGYAAPAVVALAEEMSRAIDLSRIPEIRCADIASPMVAGGRRAVLVLPQAFAKAHPPAEMRALLAHELAHILRRDYSWNVLQLFAVTLLWWHPAAWLVYARIRHERECASDEQAVRMTGSPAPLAHALFRIADAPSTRGAVAVAAGSGRLVDRISRLAEPQRSGSRRRTAPFLAGAFAALAALIVAASSTASQARSLTRAYAASPMGPPTVFTIHAQDPAGKFLVKMVRGRVLAIELGQDAVPSERVVQRGNIVTVVGASGQELLKLEVDPRGGFRWNPRHI